ncbi:MAG: hypothetical protein HYY04_01915 [Chloroflexi bacterium]|nr:hypothetical protein [Chloroflexota bacterium]
MLAALALLASVLVACWPLLVDGRVLVSLDAFAYFYPNYQYAAAQLRSGVLPLWNPYLFAGAPFLANPQTGVFYPPNLLFLALPAPHAYAWSVALHMVIAGVAMRLCARRALRMTRGGALVAALTWMLSGYLLSTTVHLNQLQALAWLPLLVMASDRIARGASRRQIAFAALIVALIAFAGHSQTLYIAGATAAVWGGAVALHLAWRERTAGWPSALGSASRRLIGLAGALGLGVALAAVQLSPTLELAGQSMRAGGLSYADAVAFSLPPWHLFRSLLPSFRDDAISTEWVGYVGFVGLGLAGLGLGTSPRGRALGLAALAAGAFLLAFGQFSPLYGPAFAVVPGLQLFRVPARWLAIATFALAALAGLGFDCLSPSPFRVFRSFRAFRGPNPPPSPLEALGPGIAVVALIGVLFIAAARRYPGFATFANVVGDPPLLAQWSAMGFVVVAGLTCQLLWPRTVARLAIAVALVGELLLAGRTGGLLTLSLAEAATALRPPEAFFRADPGLYRILALSQQRFDPGDLELIRAGLAGLPPAEVTGYINATKHQQTLTPNLPLAWGIASLDGYDGGVLPTERFVRLKELFPLDSQNLVDGRLNIQVTVAPPAGLLGWLNVRYLLMDRSRDVWVDGVYYDLAVEQPLAPGGRLQLTDLPRQRTEAIGIIIRQEGHPLSPDPFSTRGEGWRLRGTVQAVDGTIMRWQLDPASGDGASGTDFAPSAHRPVALSPAGTPQRLLFRLPLDEAMFPSAIELRNEGEGIVTVAGLTLIGRAGVSRPVPVEPALRLRYLGDVKIYENLRWQPRLYVVYGLRPVDDRAEAELAELRSPAFQPEAEVVMPAAEAHRLGVSGVGCQVLGVRCQVPGARCSDCWPHETRHQTPDTQYPIPDSRPLAPDPQIVEYRAGRVRARVTLPRPGLLVFGESWDPGWRARVDGQPAPIGRVNLIYQAVWLGAGPHDVVFEYRPTSLLIGAGLSLLALVVIGVLVCARMVIRS